MTALAGYDFLAELSTEAFQKIVQAKLSINGTTASPPFELLIPITVTVPGPVSQQIAGVADMVVTSLDTRLFGNNSVSLLLAFSSSAAKCDVPGLGSQYFAPLDGYISITGIPIGLTADKSVRLMLDVSSSNVLVEVEFSNSREYIEQKLTEIKMAFRDFNDQINSACLIYFRQLQSPPIDLNLSIVAGMDGKLDPPMRFDKLEVHCLEDLQELVLCGILLVSNHENGDYRQKTTTSIPLGKDAVVLISAEACDSLLFHPMTQQLIQGARGAITRIDDHFEQNHVAISGEVHKSGPCYDAHGSFYGEISFSVDGGNLDCRVAVSKPDVDVDIPWYCYLAPVVVFEGLGILVDIAIYGIAAYLETFLQRAFAVSSTIQVPLFGFSDVTFDRVDVGPEGLTLAGYCTATVPIGSVPSLEFLGSVVTVASTKQSEGTYHATSDWKALQGDWPYAEYLQSQVASYGSVEHLFKQPVAVQFWVGLPSDPKRYALVSPGGTIVLPSVSTGYGIPMPYGHEVNQPVHLAYTVQDHRVELRNIPAEGNYDFELNVTATEADGKFRAESVIITVEGDHMQSPWFAARDAMWQQILEGSLQLTVPVSNLNKWPVPTDGLDETIVAAIAELITLPSEQTDQVMMAMCATQAGNLARAIRSPQLLQKAWQMSRLRARVETKMIKIGGTTMTKITKEHTRIKDFFHDFEKLIVKYADIDIDLCATWMSPTVGTDAGGWIILGGRLIKVPGWQPNSAEFAKAKVAVASMVLTTASLMPPGKDREQIERAAFKSLGIEPAKSGTVAA